MVDRRVLVPRPETEVVARTAIDEVVRLGARRGAHDPWGGAATSFPVADLGTGSGAIALALARELPDAEVWATDVSDDALAVARANLAGVGSAATRVRLESGSWFDALPEALRGRLRLVVSNPPYVAEHEVADLPADVADWEPRQALVSGPTGLEAIEAILAGAASGSIPRAACSSWSSRRIRPTPRSGPPPPPGSTTWASCATSPTATGCSSAGSASRRSAGRYRHPHGALAR